MSDQDQLEREVEAALTRLATTAVPDTRRPPAPPWQERRRTVDARRFGRATPWLVAAVLLVLAGLGVGAAVTFDASAPDRAPVGTQQPSPTATASSSDGTLGDPPTIPVSTPSLDREATDTAPDDGVTTSAETTTGSETSAIAVYANCNDPADNPPAVRPSAIGLACADNGENLEGVQWSSWSVDGATGTGTLEYRTCDPDCATGSHIMRVDDVTVRLSGAVMGSTGVTVWTHLTVTPDPVGDGSYTLLDHP